MVPLKVGTLQYNLSKYKNWESKPLDTPNQFQLNFTKVDETDTKRKRCALGIQRHPQKLIFLSRTNTKHKKWQWNGQENNLWTCQSKSKSVPKLAFGLQHHQSEKAKFKKNQNQPIHGEFFHAISLSIIGSNLQLPYHSQNNVWNEEGNLNHWWVRYLHQEGP